MRVAFSGTHRVGKTTLLEAVSERLPGHATYDEPYRLLEDEGYELSPTAEDFERQLRRSLELLDEDRADILFDRCPIDFLAYLAALGEDIADRIDEVRDAVSSLDLIVFVPIDEPDCIAVPADERTLRPEVDELLQELLLDDPHALAAPVLEVRGSVAARVSQVLDGLRSH